MPDNASVQTLDWRNPEDYEYVLELSNRELAWEFLRRNSGFVHELRTLKKRRRKYYEEFEPYLSSESDAEISQRFADWRTELETLEDELANRFGLAKGIADIDFDAGAPLFEPRLSGEYGAVCLRHHIDGTDISMFDDHLTRSELYIDVRVFAETDIKCQLDDIFEMYKNMIWRHMDERIDDRHKTARLQTKLYPEYLQIWDAHSAGVPLVDIAAKLDPNNVDRKVAQGRISKRLKAATSLVQGGYLKIAAQDFRK